ncbi:MAG: hypothetical protein P8074_01325 [Anaerolineales bacterium]
MASPGLRRVRIAALILGAGLLVWLPFEDSGLAWIIIFSLAICALAAVYALIKLRPDHKKTWLYLPLTGIAAGVAITPLALSLMAFKSGVHGHGAADFTPAQVTSILQRTPIWAAGGLLIGLGTSLWQSASDGSKNGAV